MKVSLALGPRQPLSRQTAWGCLTSNLVLPGSGSLLAGRKSGYPQLALAFAGLVVTTIFGLGFIWWQLTNWSRFHNPETDFIKAFKEIWVHLRPALLGICLFVIGWLWALGTSMSILNSAIEPRPKTTPPRLDASNS